MSRHTGAALEETVTAAQRHRRLLAVILASLLAIGIAPSAAADDDTTPPVGTLVVNDGEPATNTPDAIHLDVPATDVGTGVAVVQIWFNGGGPIVVDYAPELDIAMLWWDQGPNTIEVRWQDVAGNLSEPAIATLIVDLTPPDGTAVMSDYDDDSVTVDLTAADPDDIEAVTFSCEGQASPAERPFATRIEIPYGANGLDCHGIYGWVDIEVGLRDAAGNVAIALIQAGHEPTLSLHTPDAAVTGHPFTVIPVVPADYRLPANGGCRWEFRWGNDASLDDSRFDETFGSLLFDIPQSDGVCRPWTFTLPWVPYRQYEVNLSLFVLEDDGATSHFADVRKRFGATVDSTDRRIRSSSLPIAQVLPSTYTPIVGSPVTYTRYLIGGAPSCCGARWAAWQGSGDHPNQWHQSGGSTFTITPFETGNIVVGWDLADGDWRLGALYDPPVRRRDTTDPNTTTPVQRFRSGSTGTTVPVQLTWTGSDRGWGIASYRLQRSVNGGSWTTVALPSARATTMALTLTNGKTYRFRVRATDKAGNVGSWDYGPTFKPTRRGDASSTIRYSASWRSVADPTAIGNAIHETGRAGAAARLTFTGRDIAWIAERGPGHGKAKVYIDGTYIATVDLEAGTAQPARLVFRRHWSTVGTHTIRIVGNGTTGRPIISVDGFAILR